MKLPKNIFSKNGIIRGLYPSELNIKTLHSIITAYFKLIEGERVIVAYDMHESSREIFNVFVYLASKYNKKVDSLGLQTYEIYKFAKNTFEYDGGIYIGAQIKDAAYQEIELTYNGQHEVDMEALNSFCEYEQSEDFYPADFNVDGLYKDKDYTDEYRQYVADGIDFTQIQPLKIAVDSANGMGSIFVRSVFGIGNFELTNINEEANVRFPHYLPNIENPYLKYITQHITKTDADIGIITDASGVQMVLLDEKGKLVPTSYFISALKDNYEGEFAGDFLYVQEVLKILKLLSEKGISLSMLAEEYKQPETRSIQDIDIVELRHKFDALLDNLWYTWNPHFIMPIIDLYGDGWRKNAPPKEFMAQYGVKRFEQILKEHYVEIEENYRLFMQYKRLGGWFDYNASKDTKLQVLETNPIAYFSMEYGLVDWLQIYSGGLGVLSGDYLKQVSDLKIPLVAVGIFYHEGYFHQDFGEEGEQIERYMHQDPDDYPLELARDDTGTPIEITVEVAGHDVFIRAWKLEIGNVPLYLLDTNYTKNKEWDDRKITGHLYGGDEDTRIRQEIVLGIGGARLFKALGIEPSVFHMNEGHSGFLVLEEAKRYVDDGVPFEEAIKKASDKLVFTNHTLKQAGNDKFSMELIMKHLGSYTDDLQTDIDTIFELGKDDKYADGNFSMSILGMRNAKISNAVSILHGHAAKNLWPDYDLVPVTNGVHMGTWVSPEVHGLLDRFVGETWHCGHGKVDYQKVADIPDEMLWEAHITRKKKLIHSLNTQLGLNLDPDALTFAWSRRLASYKRPDMIIKDLDRLREILNVTNQPVQILIAGKAHPKDSIGKEILRNMNKALSAPEFKNKVVVIPGYNWQLARRVISGADVWLNTPYRFEEASGTSGMKACANGVLQLTTKDGWTDEVDWYKKGWVIPEENPVKSLFDTIQYQIMPLYFDAITGSYNKYWVEMMKNSMTLVLERYSMDRMVKDYLEKIYLPIIN